MIHVITPERLSILFAQLHRFTTLISPTRALLPLFCSLSFLVLFHALLLGSTLTIRTIRSQLCLHICPYTAAMELQREQPPAYRSHDPEDLKLPSVPQNEPFQSHAHSDITLPDLQTALSRPLPPKTVHPNKLLDETFQNNKAVESQQLGQQYTSTAPPRIDASPRMNVGARPSLEAVVSPSDTGSVMSIDEPLRRSASIVSIEDPDVRLAAEALSGLGNPGEYTHLFQTHLQPLT